MKKNYPKVLLFVLFCALAGTQQAVFAQSQDVRDAGLRKRIAVIFQDVASTTIPHFYNGKISNKTLVQFGIYYNALKYPNRFASLEKSGNRTRIAEKYIASPALKYFGRKVAHQSITDSSFNYRSGYYYGYQEMFEQLAPLELRNLRVTSKGSIFIAYADVVDDFGEETIEKKKILLKKIGTGNKSRFVVIEYSPAK